MEAMIGCIPQASVLVAAGMVCAALACRLSRGSGERAALKRKIEEQTLSLNAAEEKYRLLVENLPDVIWTSDAAGNTTFISSNVEKIYGYTPKEIRAGGENIWLGRIHAEDIGRVREAYADLFRKGIKFDIKYRIRRKDEQWIWVHDRSTVTYQRDGVNYADGIFTDISRDKQLDEYMRQSQKMDAVGQLAGGMAHDFNNILTAILGYVQLPLTMSDLPAQAALDLKEVVILAKRGANLTRQMLDFSRRSVVEKRPIDLKLFAEDMLKLFKRLIVENVHVAVESEEGAFDILGDETQLQQVLTNLAINARDAMPRGGNLTLKLSRVALRAEDIAASWHLKGMNPGTWLALSVTDTGTGIPRENLDRIFEPFFTTKAPGRGTGLGLAQVYGIIRQMEGFIDVTSRANWGTTFTIYLPPQAHAAAAIKMERAEKLKHVSSDTVLLVEDEIAVRKVTRRTLESLGYRVLTAANGLEALQMYEREKDAINVVLSDMMMPVMDGIELFKTLKTRYPKVRVVMMSGYSAHQDVSNLKKAGLIAWINKPMGVKDLATALVHGN